MVVVIKMEKSGEEIKICNPHNWMDGGGEGSVKIDSLDSGLHNWLDGGTA